MEASAKNQQSQIKTMASRSMDAAGITMIHADSLAGILAAIARLSQDDAITKLASLGKTIAGDLHNEADLFREETESIVLGV
ncbi:hypothetical protein [Chromobacterium haemolyticum]|uniref:hypothetical protein n=1 Tax=Chromobacterium haemolyticum TaxID=394935 RepID=UPI0009D95308|nr:hypothetical protein [Chromobacterium haemolyticum]OQS41129.1 hypothetical protein B0T39_09210 [Chromobacterium haemolyticum]